MAIAAQSEPLQPAQAKQSKPIDLSEPKGRQQLACAATCGPLYLEESSPQLRRHPRPVPNLSPR
jgi:hypothetical protein